MLKKSSTLFSFLVFCLMLYCEHGIQHLSYGAPLSEISGNDSVLHFINSLGYTTYNLETDETTYIPVNENHFNNMKVCTDLSGNAWYMTYDDNNIQLLCIENNEKVFFDTGIQINSGYEPSILYIDRQNRLWFRGNSSQLMSFDINTHEFTTYQNVISPRAMIQDSRDQSLWVSSLSGLYRYINGEWSFINSIDGIFLSDIWQFVQTADGTMWFRSYYNLYKISDNSCINMNLNVGLSNKNMYTIENKIYVISDYKLYIYDTISNQLTETAYLYVYSMFANDQTVFIHNYSGLQKLGDIPLTLYPGNFNFPYLIQDMKKSPVDQSVWVFSTYMLAKLQNSQWTYYPFNLDNPDTAFLYQMAINHNNEIYAYLYDDVNLVNQIVRFNFNSNTWDLVIALDTYIHSGFFFDNENRLWFIYNDAITYLQNNEIHSFPSTTDFSNRNLQLDQQNHVCYNNLTGIYFYNENTNSFTSIPISDVDNFIAISPSNYWYCQNGMIYHVTDNATTSDTLSSSSRLALDNQNNLWLYTYPGLAKYTEEGLVSLFEIRYHYELSRFLIDSENNIYMSDHTDLYIFKENEMVHTDSHILPADDMKLQNYPNPFNPSTTISYNLKKEEKIELAVYNLKGQKVNTLVSELQPSGEHQIVWNGHDQEGKPVSSGIYFYRLRTGTSSQIKKMILMK